MVESSCQDVMQTVAPMTEYVPASQSWQATAVAAPGLPYLPAAHTQSVLAVLPVPTVMADARHGMQVAMEVCFVAADQEPAGQTEHTETAPPPYLPASQLVQSVLAAEVFKTPVAE